MFCQNESRKQLSFRGHGQVPSILAEKGLFSTINNKEEEGRRVGENTRTSLIWQTSTFWQLLQNRGRLDNIDYKLLAGRLALLASRSTGLEKFGFIEIKPIFWDYPSFVLATEVSKVSFEVAYLVKNKFLCTAGAGRT